MSKSKLFVGTVVGLLFATAVLFQNCSGGPQVIDQLDSATSNRLESGNGGGYGGKVTYTRTSEGANCPDGSSVEAAVEVQGDGKAFLTRNNCQDLSAQEIPLADVHLMAHNDKNIIFQDAVFDLASKTDGLTSLLCRGEEADGATGGKNVVDATIRTQINNGVTSYFGRVILGVYDSGNNLTKTLDMGEVALMSPLMPMPGLELYASQTQSQGEVFQLQVRRADHLGYLQYRTNIVRSGPGKIPSSFNAYEVHKLNCYEQ